MWTCSKCSTRLGDVVYVCWRCGTNSRGEEDTDFVTADEAGPIVEPTDYLRLEVGKRPDEELPGSSLELASCFRADQLAWAKFVSDLLAAEGIRSTVEPIDYRGGVGGRVMVRVEDVPRTRPIVETFLARMLSREDGTSDPDRPSQG